MNENNTDKQLILRVVVPGKDITMFNRYIAAVVIGAAVIAVVTVSGIVVHLYYKRKNRTAIKSKPETLEEKFVKVWTQALKESAQTFNGLYQGLTRVVEGKAKKPEKVMREWCARTRYQWEDEQPNALCEEIIIPLLEKKEYEEIGKWAGMLLQAAGDAGITKSEEEKLILDEHNVNDYTEWEGESLYIGDEVEVISPTWYQNGTLLEQGRCQRRMEDVSE